MSQWSFSQNTIKGYVKSKLNNLPLEGVIISLNGANNSVSTDKDGMFALGFNNVGDTLEINLIGYKREVLILSKTILGKIIHISLEEKSLDLDEVVVSTGYYRIPKERVTGSFGIIDNELINQSVGMDILSRIEGVSGGIAFDRNNLWNEQEGIGNIRVRGVSTIHSNSSPLIILDDFPYEGDVNSINPNDVENITILKDAAAASIWGARAGNGVIVINTKRGKFNQPVSLTFSSNAILGDKPDLFYDPRFFSSKESIEVQKELFLRGAFIENDRTVLSPALELMIKERDGAITSFELNEELNRLTKLDIRKSASDHLYRKSLTQQYSLGFSGGSDRISFYTGVGLDKQDKVLKNNTYQRVTLNNSLKYLVSDFFDLYSEIFFVNNKSNNNGLGISDLNPTGISLYPYAQIVEENGKPSSIIKNNRQTYTESAVERGLLDWEFRPLDEVLISDNTIGNQEIRLSQGLSYRFLSKLSFDMKYQYQKSLTNTRSFYHPESYFARNRINMFTQPDGSHVIPVGGILQKSHTQHEGQYGRTQINYSESFSSKHDVDALIGFEIRQEKIEAEPGSLLYGYNNEVLTSSSNIDYNKSYSINPLGSSRVFAPSNILQNLTDRFLSYYGNIAYTFDRRYTVTTSARWDASNLFGVRTNQKGIPLLSIGGAWNLTEELFLESDNIDLIRIRATYGHNGNINKSISTYPKVRYTTSNISRVTSAVLNSLGNSNLRWEKVATTNMGIDFQFFKNRISGSLELYNKNASDLIGHDYLDPTTGVIEENGRFPIDNRVNYASLNTKGMEVELTNRYQNGNFRWNTTVLFSYTKNIVTKYMAEDAPRIGSYFPAQYNAPPRVGQSFDVIYSLPWHGLNNANGQQFVSMDGEKSHDYNGYISSLSPDDLLIAGLSVPPLFGSFRNVLAFKGIALSLNVIYKLGYHFKRSSVNYSQLLSGGFGHRDFSNRWRNEGDELSTTVPSMPANINLNRDLIYTNSEVLIEKGDHIRLKDINLSYDLNNLGNKNWVRNAKLYLHGDNMGIIWRANKHRLDPDYPLSSYPPPRSISIGIKVMF